MRRLAINVGLPSPQQRLCYLEHWRGLWHCHAVTHTKRRDGRTAWIQPESPWPALLALQLLFLLKPKKQLNRDPAEGSMSPETLLLHLLLLLFLFALWDQRTLDSNRRKGQRERLAGEPSRVSDEGDPQTQQMAKFLSQDQINEFKECFSLYDKKHKGKIKASDLLTVMRCLGVSPIPGEVARHLQQHKIDRNGELDFSTFLSIMYKQMQQEDPKNEILLAMLMADTQKTGFISVAELRAKLMNLGEKMSREEVDNLLKDTNVGHNGIVKYEDLVRSITLPLPDY